jgi:hemolysin III
MELEEKFNTLTHVIGAVLALVGGVILVIYASLKGEVWKITSFSVYGVTLFSLYLVSSLYHGLRGRVKNVFRVLDHQAIYLLIAGTYTPFTLVTLRGAWGWFLFGTTWGLAVIGIVLDAVPSLNSGKRILPIIIYVTMGWMVLIALGPLINHLPATGFKWLFAGGVFYTVGIIFYALSHYYKYAHGVWHLFVMAGSLSHYICILFFVA